MQVYQDTNNSATLYLNTYKMRFWFEMIKIETCKNNSAKLVK